MPSSSASEPQSALDIQVRLSPTRAAVGLRLGMSTSGTTARTSQNPDTGTPSKLDLQSLGLPGSNRNDCVNSGKLKSVRNVGNKINKKWLTPICAHCIGVVGQGRSVAVIMNNPRDTLLRLLVDHAYSYKPGGFVLASGAVSDEYLDCRQAVSNALALPAIGQVFLSMLVPHVEAVGGLTMGADPIAISVAYASATSSNRIAWFSVRKERKEHGRKRLIEGNVRPPANVVIVDDVVTSGGSTIDAIRKAKEFGLRIVQVIVLVA